MFIVQAQKGFTKSKRFHFPDPNLQHELPTQNLNKDLHFTALGSSSTLLSKIGQLKSNQDQWPPVSTISQTKVKVSLDCDLHVFYLKF